MWKKVFDGFFFLVHRCLFCRATTAMNVNINVGDEDDDDDGNDNATT